MKTVGPKGMFRKRPDQLAPSVFALEKPSTHCENDSCRYKMKRFSSGQRC